jgi:hypothetical protein
MIVMLYINEKGLHWWYWLLVPLIVIGNIFDLKKSFPQEIEANLMASKSFRRLCDDVKEIKKKIAE